MRHPKECVRREVHEETGLSVEVLHVIDAWVYAISTQRSVLVVTYACHLVEERVPRVSEEHDGVRTAALDEISRIAMPDGYKNSIARWSDMSQ